MTKQVEQYVYKYSDKVLKNGYEAMARINLNYAEESMIVDSGELVSYENILSEDDLDHFNHLNLESDEFDD